MDNSINKFRKATFGGFNRKDVIDYIEKIQNEFYDYKKETEKTVVRLNEKISQLEALSSVVEPKEDVAPECCDEPVNSSDESDSASEINMATAKLRNVTDELCRSLNDFMDKLTENSVSVMLEIPCEVCGESVEECETFTCDEHIEEFDRVQSILKGVSCAFVQENKLCENTVSDESDDIKNNKSVTDILSSASFVC